MEKTILLTGATGFLGSHLLEAFLQKGYKVVVLKRSTSNIWRIQDLITQIICYDVDIQPLENAFTDQYIDYVVHTACHYGRNSDSLSNVIETNLMFGLRIIELSIKYQVTTFINTDTFYNTNIKMSKYHNVYSLSKKQFTEWLKKSSNKIKVINMILEHVYGPKDNNLKFIPRLINKLNENVPEINFTKGIQLRDFIYIEDVVSAYLLSLEKIENLEYFTQLDIGTVN